MVVLNVKQLVVIFKIIPVCKLFEHVILFWNMCDWKDNKYEHFMFAFMLIYLLPKNPEVLPSNFRDNL